MLDFILWCTFTVQLDNANILCYFHYNIELNWIVIGSFRRFLFSKICASIFFSPDKIKNTAVPPTSATLNFPPFCFRYMPLHDIAHFQVRVMVFYRPSQQYRFSWYICCQCWDQNVLKPNGNKTYSHIPSSVIIETIILVTFYFNV